MADNGSQDASGVGTWRSFNTAFIVYMIVCGVLAIFFLLYFNRVFASVVSRIIRAYTWHHYRIYIDIKAIQISLLAGRIFFTGLRYHGNNETIRIQMGHITWAYWRRRVRDASIATPQDPAAINNGSAPADSNTKKAQLPCRIDVNVSGVEWFVYNRSAAYDAILDAMSVDFPIVHESVDGTEGLANGSMKPRQRAQRSSQDLSTKKRSEDGFDNEKIPLEGRYSAAYPTMPPSGSTSDLADETASKDQELPMMLRLLPIHFNCDKAALVMGNENTKAVFIAKAASVSGDIDAAACSTPDPYRQTFKINLEHPVVEMRENEVFKEDQFKKAARDRQAGLDTAPMTRPFFRRQRRRVLGHLRNLVPYWRTSVESFSVDSRDGGGAAEAHVPGSNHWQGLSRYLNDDDEDDKLRWSSVEYAAVRTVVDSPEATLTLLWDVPGKVMRSHRSNASSGDTGTHDHVNGVAPPAWDISLSLKGGLVTYGPWADRQRVELQRVFFPGLNKDATPAEKLPVGANRVPTVFNFYVEFDEEVTVRVPTREDSRNWKWKKEAAALRQYHKEEQRRDQGRDRKAAAANTTTQQRPYGWLDIKIAANATVSYSMDMMASSAGYSNKLKIELPATEVSTSVNHSLLWRSGAQRISGDLSTPLKWNALRNWRFSFDSDELELFILRDHIFLLTDLIDDWGNGPPAEYLLFTPFKYHLDLNLQKLKMYLNVNDCNIVNSPTDFVDNTFIILSSPCLTVGTCISLDSYRPTKNAVPLDIRAETLNISLHVPPWNTQASYLTSKNIGRIESVTAKGRYNYNATTSTANTDTLVLDVSGQSPSVHLYGFLVRYFLQLKDNYFGDHIHFRTLDEYQQSLRSEAGDPGSAPPNKPPPKKSNDLDIILSIRADDSRLALPANLYSARRHVQIEIPTLSADLRFTNYYMDLDLCLSPLSLSLGTDDGGASTPISAASRTQLFIDGFTIYGHRLFGLPPTEPTYLCNWDLSVGAITGECSADFLMTLARGGKAFGFNFDDDENALIPYSSIVMYDVTFLRVFVQSVQVWLHVDEAAFLFSTGLIDIKYNDWARTHYSKRANINIPTIEVACVNAESASRHRSRPQTRVQTDTLLRTSIRFALVGRKHDFVQARKLQQELIRRHDQRTHRAGFLLVPGVVGGFVPDPVDPPAQSVPPAPQPTLTADEDRSFSTVTSRRHPKLRQKSSFLSLSSSSNADITRPSSIRSVRRHRPPHHATSYSAASRGDESRPGTAKPIYSTPAGHRSGVHEARHDGYERRDPLNTRVAFSSQYYPPYFSLENVRPDSREANSHGINHGKGSSPADDAASFNLEDVDPDHLSQDSAHQSFLLEFPTGISAFLNAPSLRHVASLLSALQPTDPEDILDGLQVDTMTGIFDMQKTRDISGQITELSVRLPQANIRFLNCSDQDSDPLQEEQDQYDITIKSLSLAARSESRVEQSGENFEARDSKLSFNLRLASADVSAAERFTDSDETQAAVLAGVDNIMASLGTKDVSYLDVDVGSLRTMSSSGKIEYLASLIHRTAVLATEMEILFSSTASKSSERLAQFVYRVISEGQGASDPPFVVRPSAVLRAAPDHLRTYDSWKLNTRLRQMWFTLDRSTKENISRDCIYCNSKTPVDAKEQVMIAFDRWRSWDLDNPTQSVFIGNIFGKTPDLPTPASNKPPSMAVARVHEIQFILDPGPKQNQIFVGDLTVRVEEKSPVQGESHGDLAIEGPLTIVNIFCSEAGINVNWDLCRLADDMLRLYNKDRDRPAVARSKLPKTPKTNQPWSPKSLHVVTVLALGSIRIETINLISEFRSNDLKISVLSVNSKPDTTNTNIILGCDATTTKLRSQAQSLLSLRLKHPSIFVGHEMLVDAESAIHTVKATASSQDMKFVVKQDPVVLCEVADMLVRDEVAQLHHLKQQVPPSSSSPAQVQNPKVAERLSTFRVNLAMFLDSYTITVPLLQSLTYTIRGVVSRAAMAANFGKEVVFDFDIKENSHEMQININSTPRSISLLQIPPTNGRVESVMSPGEHSITVWVSVEPVKLDASAVYSLLAALNRPEISSTLTDLQQQGKVIQEHLGEIFGSSDPAGPPSPTNSASKLIYVVHSTLAGIEIFSTTPLNSDIEPFARLSFGLDSVHFRLANKIDDGPILDRPEVHLDLREIKFDIAKGSTGDMHSCGNFAISALITATSRESEDGANLRAIDFESNKSVVNLSPNTISTFVDVLGYMSDRIKDLDTSRELEYLRKLRQSKPKITINDKEDEPEKDIFDSFLSTIMYSFVMRDIQIAWLVSSNQEVVRGQEDLVISFKKIEFTTRVKKTAKLTIEDFRLQMVPPGQDKALRSLNSALLPEVILNLAYVSTSGARRLAFQAIGKSLDIRITSAFIVPASHLQRSLSLSTKNVQQASEYWTPIVLPEKEPEKIPEQAAEASRTFLGSKRLESLLVDADFAGAVVHLSAKKSTDESSSTGQRTSRPALAGKYGQFSTDNSDSDTVLRSPGLAFKTEYRDNDQEDATLYGEIKVDASRNIIYPSVVPLILDITSSIKEVVSDDQAGSPTSPSTASKEPEKEKPADVDGENILTVDPSAVLGRVKLNLGLRICKQEFTLSCQPIGRVAATACFEDIYITCNTVQSAEHGNFFAISGTFSNFHTAVQHVYSQGSTASFAIDSLVLSLMNSKHVSGTSGVSAILKVSPMAVAVNAKQLQDFLLFREIWMPSEVRQGSAMPLEKVTPDPAAAQGHLMQRYQQVAATAAFPWTASISISGLDVTVDLGQSLGKPHFSIENLWLSSKKTSDWEQNLCLGFDRIGVDSAGRLGGFVTLQEFKLRTSIEWPDRERALNETPRVQASIGFSQFKMKASFDYQAFLVADIRSLYFLMYNVRQDKSANGDRLVASFDGDAVQVFGTTSSAAQSVALWKAIQRLIQERKASFETSLRDIEKFMRRRSSATQAQIRQIVAARKPSAGSGGGEGGDDDAAAVAKSPISLDTDVVVTLKALNLGVFPNTFSDHQVFKLEALNAQARFAASMESATSRRIHSILGLTLGQLRIGLAGVRQEPPKPGVDLSVEHVVASATGSRGGTILKVPKVEATMQTWQKPGSGSGSGPSSRTIEYVFKSAFEGKVEVGWNYSRISFIRGMWATHSKALAATWGREIPTMSAIKVTGVGTLRPPSGGGGDAGTDSPAPTAATGGGSEDDSQQQKITAEVNVPQSKYEYVALEPPVIETPQLRDMGEATPPLEWIGLHRDRLPNLTHQIVIVSLLELAGEVEEAYSKILGSS